MIRRVEAHPRQELLQHDRHFLQAFVVLNVVLDQLAAGDSEMRLLLDDAAVRYATALLRQVVVRRSEAWVQQSADFVFFVASLTYVIVERDVYFELRHRGGDLLGLLVLRLLLNAVNSHVVLSLSENVGISLHLLLILLILHFLQQIHLFLPKLVQVDDRFDDWD